MKRYAIAAMALIFALAGTMTWLFSNVDTLVTKAIESYGTQLAGVPVRVTAVDIGMSSGHGSIRGLTVANPPGYKSRVALSIAEIVVDFDHSTVHKNPVVITEINAQAPSVTYERGPDGSNFERLQKNVDAFAAHGGEPSKSTDTAATLGGPNFIIRRLTLSNGTLALISPSPGGPAGMALGDIVLTGIGDAGGSVGGGATPARVSTVVMKAIVKAVIQKAASLGVDDGVGRGIEATPSKGAGEK